MWRKRPRRGNVAIAGLTRVLATWIVGCLTIALVLICVGLLVRGCRISCLRVILLHVLLIRLLGVALMLLWRVALRLLLLRITLRIHWLSGHGLLLWITSSTSGVVLMWIAIIATTRVASL